MGAFMRQSLRIKAVGIVNVYRIRGVPIDASYRSRQLPEQWELRDRLQLYFATRPWQKPLRLAGPVTLLRLALVDCNR
jgi:hypothetical protein